MSDDDRRALDLISGSIRNVNNRYTVDLPWRRPDAVLPDNRSVALRRLYGLESRFRKDPLLAVRYTKADNTLTTQQEIEDHPPRTWYLPHHAVIYPHKPDKPRVAFDAAATFQGTSLNRELLKGPDLLTPLPAVLLRFRTRAIPISADIEKMYHRVLVLRKDQPSLRFLWRPPGTVSPPLTYQMRVHVFGSKSSPTICIYALRRIAQDNDDPEMLTIIKESFYVDNFLHSVDTPEEAKQIATRLTNLLLLGGFRLTKWQSTSREFLRSIEPDELSSPELDLGIDPLPVERTFGLHWNYQSYSFGFKLRLGALARTKRQILRDVSSIFDPLGVLAPVILTAKILIQEIWRIELEWDELLSDGIVTIWQSWVKTLESVANLQIPRQYFSGDSDISAWTLHVFTDASERGFGAVAYLRTEPSACAVALSFVMAKTRVAPLKQLSIPRLELQACVLGCRLATVITSELRINVNRVTFWSDSQTALQWIHSKTCRYHAFVAHRIGEILSVSSKEQWRHVPGTLNPADDCSRGINVEQSRIDCRWLAGPTFLLQRREEWPSTPDSGHPDPDSEDVVAPKWINAITEHQPDFFERIINKISSFTLLKRIVARFIRCIHNRRHRNDVGLQRSGPLQVIELQAALRVLVSASQRNSFPKERHSLASKTPVPSDSRLLKLSPFLDNDGLIRVGGRLERSDAPFDYRHPLVLSDDCLLTKTIIWYYHLNYPVPNSHSRTERLLADLRAQFWILRGRNVIKQVVNKCIPCRRLYAAPVPPLMAPLPTYRLQPTTHAFVNTGVDFMGPFQVTMGRRTEKRWLCLFTCLTTRAVHLEVAHRLDADSFLQSFQRFVDRRGHPSTVCSDNGTNFVAGERELKEAFAKLDQNLIVVSLADRNMQWRFSPPSGPHFGGVWERLTLHTVVVNVEALLNSRPLTDIATDPDEPEPLTPNHFLLGRSHPYVPLDVPSENAVVSRRRFIAAQALLDQFWRRWMEEYIPHLTERKKWMHQRRNLQIDDIVLVIDANSVRGQWPVGRVVKVMAGPDGIVRVARVRTLNGEYDRPVVKLCVLDTAPYAET